MKKYYTPDIAEFHVGFEYEIYVPEKQVWSKEIFYLNESHIDLVKFVGIQIDSTQGVRVKFLDKEDIESLGWRIPEAASPFVFLFVGKLHTYLMHLVRNEHGDWIMIEDEDNYQYFSGKIKNKSELQRVIKMVVI